MAEADLMTTIAYRDGMLAADGRSTSGNGWIVSDNEVKLFKLSLGVVAAVSGELAQGHAFLDALYANKTDLDTGPDTRVVILTKTELRIYEGKGSFTQPLDQPGAWGSGMPPAMAALHMGASAEEAVRIACLVDPHSGGTITVMAPE